MTCYRPKDLMSYEIKANDRPASRGVTDPMGGIVIPLHDRSRKILLLTLERLFASTTDKPFKSNTQSDLF